MVQRRITNEKNNHDTLDNKVAEFCGKETIQTMHRKVEAEKNLFCRLNDWRRPRRKATKTKSQTRPKKVDKSRNRKPSSSDSRNRRLSSADETQRSGTFVSGSRSSVDLGSFRKPSLISSAV